MTQRNDDKMLRLSRERALLVYGRALEQADFETMASVHKMAEADPVLERQLSELEEAELALLPELALEDDAELVRRLLHTHISGPAEGDAEPAPITVDEVAGRLLAERKVAQGDEEALLKLQGHRVPLPARMGLADVRRLVAELEVRASEPFLRLFREAALLLGVGHSQQAGFAAARRQKERNSPADPGLHKDKEPRK